MKDSDFKAHPPRTDSRSSPKDSAAIQCEVKRCGKNSAIVNLRCEISDGTILLLPSSPIFSVSKRRLVIELDRSQQGRDPALME